jgi:GxxExxY protein
MPSITKSYLKELTYEVIGAAIEVHKAMGPGLLESVYHECMCIEVRLRGMNYESEMQMDAFYKGERVAARLRCDMFIEGCLVAEFKAAKEIAPVDEAQLLSYMNLLQAPKGIIINFNCVNIFKEGQKTFVNKYYEMLQP